MDIIKQDQFVSLLSEGILEHFRMIHAQGEMVVREKIANLEDWLNGLVAQGVEEEEIPIVHRFATGVYVREVHIPKGTLLVGKLHRHDHVNFISSGCVSVLTKDGAEFYKAPCTMVSSAGTKRALYAHEDTVWSTIHQNPENSKDVDKLEEFIIAKDYGEFPLSLSEK